MSVDQVLHLAEVGGLLLVSLVGFLAARTLARIETKLDKHDEKLTVHGERLVSLEAHRSAAQQS